MEQRLSEDAGVTGAEIARRRPDRPPESRHEGFLQAAGAERLDLVSVKGAEPRENLVGVGHLMINANAHLVDVLDLLPHRR